MTDGLEALTVVFTEFYYWITVVLMFLIHVGFCMYEVGASRYKHHQHTLMKNTMLIPLVTVTWFLFGWWIYWAFPTGPGIAPSIMNESAALITDESAFSAKWYVPSSNLMAVNLGDHISGVFWAAFLLFSWTAASIVSGAVIERITTFAFGISFQLPVLLSLLARVGFIDSEYLKSRRKYVIVIIFAVAALLTPPDPITQIGLGIPLLILYELSILSVKLIEKKKNA